MLDDISSTRNFHVGVEIAIRLFIIQDRAVFI